MLTATQIARPWHAAVGHHFCAEHPFLSGVWVVSRVPPPQLPTIHGVMFWGHDGYVDDADEAKHFPTCEVASRFANLLNR